MDPLNIITEAIGNKYRILNVIGKGGMATVYKAIHKSLNRTVALKVIHQNLVHDDEFIKRFLREAQTCASLNHPNIVTVYDVDSVGSVHYMSMEYLEGRTIRDLLAEKGRLSVEETVQYMIPLAEALSYMHGRKVFHRDVKSSNVIVTNSGRPVLMDFGIVLSEGSDPLSHDGAILGTPEYMSPEQAKGECRIDGRSDIYSLGMIMYECLTGQLPFQAENYFATLNRVVYDVLPTVTSVNPKVPKWLSSIISGCLIKDREERIQTGTVLVRALRNKEKPDLPPSRPKGDPETRKYPKPPKPTPVDPEDPDKDSKYSKVTLFVIVAALIVILFIIGYIVFSPPSIKAPLITNDSAIKVIDTTKIIVKDRTDLKERIQKLMVESDQLIYAGDTERALVVLNSILEFDPLNRSVLQKIEEAKGKLLRELISSAITFLEEEDYDKALIDLNKAVRLSPNQPEAKQLLQKARAGQLISKGQRYLESKEFDKAIDAYSNAKFLDPSIVGIDELIGKANDKKTKYNYFKGLNISEVRIKGSNSQPYFLGTSEVTQRLWVKIMDNNPGSFTNNDLLPVENVSYNDVMSFISELNKRTGMNFRLPTENEWMFAAKGGNQSRNYEFSGSDNLSDVAWFDTNSPREVGTKKPNELGLYDMNGNVWEWTATRQGNMIVTKGGGWFSTVESCNFSSQQLMPPNKKDRYTGFRLCRDE